MNNKKIFLSTTVTTILTMIMLLLLLVSPAQALEVDEFSLSSRPDENIQLHIIERKIIISGLPETDDYAFIWIWLVKDGEAAQKTSESIIARKYSEDYGYYVTYNVNTTRSGFYCLNVLHSSEEYSTYRYLINDYDIPTIITKNKTISFSLAPVFEDNKKIYQSSRSDADALEFYLQPDASSQSDDTQIIQLAADLTKDIEDTYEKVAVIHQWVCDNIWYDFDSFHKRVERTDETATTVLNLRRGICAGYTNLTTALLRASGIPTKKVNGFALGQSTDGKWTSTVLSNDEVNHVWNEVFVNGRWLIIDATWNSGNDYEYGEKTASTGLKRTTYFDASLEFFSASHRINAYSEEHIPVSIPSTWAADDVYMGYQRGLIPHMMYAKFQQKITRQEFCELLVRFIETMQDQQISSYIVQQGESIATKPYRDTNSNAVALISSMGIVSGAGDGNFYPQNNVSREQVAVMLYRLIKMMDITVPQVDAPIFQDNDKIANWAAKATAFVTSCQDISSGDLLMGGMGQDMFMPTAGCTREQAFIMMLRLYNMVRSQV